MRSKIVLCALFAVLIVAGVSSTALASDHDDTVLLKALGRHDGRITDLFAFTRGDRLVLILCTNPAIPIGVTNYTFPSDLKLRIAIDNRSQVRYDNPADVATYGGTVVKPNKIGEDVSFEVTFKHGTPRLKVHGLHHALTHAEAGRPAPRSTTQRRPLDRDEDEIAEASSSNDEIASFEVTAEPDLSTFDIHEGGNHDVRFFIGLRDDPFIRGPRIGRNVGAIVIDVPLASVLRSQPSLLIYATSEISDIHGQIADLGARSLRSQLPENLALNDLLPKHHQSRLGVPPDVVIYDTSRPAAYPNGRELADDVVNLVGDSRILDTDFPFPAVNDVLFLEDFPYLPAPHVP